MTVQENELKCQIQICMVMVFEMFIYLSIITWKHHHAPPLSDF